MIREALEQFAASSAKTWQHDRSQTVGASEVGQCARRVFFLKNEGDTVYGAGRNEDHEDGWGAKVRGTIYENHWWEPALRAAFGDRLLFSGADQRTFVSGFLSATPDGLLLQDPEPLLLECKTADPRTNLAEAKPEHVFQVQVQMGLVRELTNHRPARAIISYTDTSFWNEVKEFEVAFDHAVYEQAKQRAAEIMTARSPDELKPEGYISGGRECDLCPFSSACGKLKAGRVPDSSGEIDPEAKDRVATLAHQIKSRKASADAAAQETKELEEELREVLAGAGTRKVAGDDFSVSWAALKGRPSWDHKALREAAAAAGVDVDSFQTAGDPSDRLTITLKN